jgi:dTDP-glucose 4,6-dehydratase
VTQAILDELGKPWSLVRSVPDRPGHDRRYALDGRKIRALGWRPRVAFEDGIRRTVRWYTANEDWWRSARSGEWDEYYRRQYGWRLERSVEA